MKFKVGDKVRLTREGIFRYLYLYFPSIDYKKAFETMEIEKVKGRVYACKDFDHGIAEEYLELVPEEPEFKEGEVVEVSNEEKYWFRRIFITELPKKVDYPYVCVHKNYEKSYKEGGSYDISTRAYARKLRPSLTRKEIAERFGVAEDFILKE